MISGIRPPASPLLPFAALGEEIPRPVRELVDHLLARLPEGRPLHAQAVIEKLEPLLGETGAGAGEPPDFGWRRSLSTGIALAMVFAAGAAASGGRWNSPAAGTWDPLFPIADSWPAPLALLSAGTLLAGIALLGGRVRRGFPLRTGLGVALFAGAILVSCGAGAATGAQSLLDLGRRISVDHPANRAVLAGVFAFCGIFLAGSRRAKARSKIVGTCMILAAAAATALASKPGPWREVLDALRRHSPAAWPLLGAALSVTAGCVALIRLRSVPRRILAGSVFTILAASLAALAVSDAGVLSVIGQLRCPAGALALGGILALGSRSVLPGRSELGTPPPQSIRMDGTTFSTPTPTAKPS